MPLVEFRQPFQIHRGPLFNAGERALVSDAEARAALQQRAGILIQDARGYEYDGRRALLSPPSHKQVTAPPAKK